MIVTFIISQVKLSEGCDAFDPFGKSRPLPVRSFCIIPCLIRRALASLVSRASASLTCFVRSVMMCVSRQLEGWVLDSRALIRQHPAMALWFTDLFFSQAGLVVCAGFAMVSVCLSVAKAGEPPPEAAEVAAQWLAHPETHAPGISVAAFDRSGIIWSGGFGLADPENEVPAGARTLYHFASVTKVYTTLVLAQMASEGLLDIDDPVSKYIPEFIPRYPEPGARAITLRDLATHAAGVTNVWGRGRLTNQLTEAELLDRMRDYGLAIQPGYKNKYSNYGVSVLGLALARVAGKPYEAMVRERVLEPLGMTSTGFEELYDHPDLARGHWFSDGKLGSPGRSPPFDAHAPSSALVSHVEDMARFGIAHISRGPSDVVPEPVRDRIFVLHGTGGGLGWRYRTGKDIPRWWHLGAWGGHYTRLAVRTDIGVGVAVATNGGPWGYDPDVEFLALLSDHADLSELKARCGEYTDEQGDPVVVTLSDGPSFALEITGVGRLMPISRHSYVVRDERGRETSWVRFIEENDERVMLWETRRLVMRQPVP